MNGGNMPNLSSNLAAHASLSAQAPSVQYVNLDEGDWVLIPPSAAGTIGVKADNIDSCQFFVATGPRGAYAGHFPRMAGPDGHGDPHKMFEEFKASLPPEAPVWAVYYFGEPTGWHFADGSNLPDLTATMYERTYDYDTMGPKVPEGGLHFFNRRDGYGPMYVKIDPTTGMAHIADRNGTVYATVSTLWPTPQNLQRFATLGTPQASQAPQASETTPEVPQQPATLPPLQAGSQAMAVYGKALEHPDQSRPYGYRGDVPATPPTTRQR